MTDYVSQTMTYAVHGLTTRLGTFLATAVLVASLGVATSASAQVTITPVHVQAYGEMFAYANVTATVIAVTDQYHAIHGIMATGAAMSGVTFTAGSTGPIASVAQGAVGDGKVTITDVAHGLVTGDYITISNSTDYNVVFMVTWLSADTFEIPETWTETRTGTWIQGDYLTIQIAGMYAINWTAAAGSASASVENYKIEVSSGLGAVVADLDDSASTAQVDNGAAFSSLNGGCMARLAAGTRLWMQVKQTTTGNDNVTFTNANLRVHRIGS